MKNFFYIGFLLFGMFMIMSVTSVSSVNTTIEDYSYNVTPDIPLFNWDYTTVSSDHMLCHNVKKNTEDVPIKIGKPSGLKLNKDVKYLHRYNTYRCSK